MAQPDDALARSGRRVPHAAQPCLDLVVDVGAAAQVEVMDEHRWLTVVSPEHPDGPELVLEPGEHPAAPAVRGPVRTAVLDDTCGKLIQIAAAAAG